ncbi:thioredoxin family protein [Pradoshia sp.]
MKKVLIFSAVVVLIFAVIAILTNQQKAEKTAGNPYGTDNLKSSTVDLLDDENYQNIITPDELDQKLEEDESITVYFFSPECIHCINTTPILMPVAEDMDEHVYQYNLLEYENGWNEFNIQSTPTLVKYENGKEKSRIVGEHSKEEFEEWFQANE